MVLVCECGYDKQGHIARHLRTCRIHMLMQEQFAQRKEERLVQEQVQLQEQQQRIQLEERNAQLEEQLAQREERNLQLEKRIAELNGRLDEARKPRSVKNVKNNNVKVMET